MGEGPRGVDGDEAEAVVRIMQASALQELVNDFRNQTYAAPLVKEIIFEVETVDASYRGPDSSRAGYRGLGAGGWGRPP